MIRTGVSNIALPAYDQNSELAKLSEFGLSGLEIAPSRVWQDTWKGLSGAEVNQYRQAVSSAGLDVIGLHSLLYDQPALSLFDELETLQNPLYQFRMPDGKPMEAHKVSDVKALGEDTVYSVRYPILFII